MNVKVSIENNSTAAASVTVSTQIFELVNGQKTGKPISSTVPITTTIAAGASNSSTMPMRVTNPKLWNLKNPNLYAAVTTVAQNSSAVDGVIVDTYETDFGIRTIKFDADTGFFLNGEQIKLNGVCDHHDLGALGAALNVRACSGSSKS